MISCLDTSDSCYFHYTNPQDKILANPGWLAFGWYKRKFTTEERFGILVQWNSNSMQCKARAEILKINSASLVISCKNTHIWSLGSYVHHNYNTLCLLKHEHFKNTRQAIPHYFPTRHLEYSLVRCTYSVLCSAILLWEPAWPFGPRIVLDIFTMHTVTGRCLASISMI